MTDTGERREPTIGSDDRPATEPGVPGDALSSEQVSGTAGGGAASAPPDEAGTEASAPGGSSVTEPGALVSPGSLERLDASFETPEELARSDREAAEALRTGAFEGAGDTVRMRRGELLSPQGLGVASPLAAGDGARPDGPEGPGAVPAPPDSQGAPTPDLGASGSSPAAGASPAQAPSGEPPSSSPPERRPLGEVLAEGDLSLEGAPPPAESAPAEGSTSPASAQPAEGSAPPAPAQPAEGSAPPASALPADGGAPAPAMATESALASAPAVSPESEAALAAAVAAPVVRDETAPGTERFERDRVSEAGSAAPPAEFTPLPGDDTRKLERAAAAAAAAPRPSAKLGKSSGVLKAPAAKRTEEDDRLLAALLFLDAPIEGLQKAPSPFATIAGVSLLKRAAAAVKASGVPKVILGGRIDAPTLAKAKAEFAGGGFTGALGTWDGTSELPTATRGRILILDASGVHDPGAVARLARWKGERACVLVATEGDGLRVQVEGGRVREVGTSLVPFDGVTCGAMNVPIPLFSRLTELGAMGALLSLAREGLLGASIEHQTFAREILSENGLSEARMRLMEQATGGSQDSLLNRLIHRRLSRPLSSVLLSVGVSPMIPTVFAGILGLAGAVMFSGLGLPPTVPVFAAGAALLLVSLVLDCAGDELAALGMRTGGRVRRFLDRVFDISIPVAALVALGNAGEVLKVDGALTFGAFAAGGALLAGFLALLARPEDGREAADAASRAVELLAARLRNREVAYVFLAVVVAHLVVNALEPGSVEALRWSLIGLAALAHAFWVALAVLLLARPKRA